MTGPVPPLPGPPTGPTTWPAQAITVDADLCGHLDGDLHDEKCAYVRGVARGEYASPEAYMATGEAATLPRHCPGLEPLTDPALREAS